MTALQKDRQKLLRDQLRKELYRSIRAAVDRSVVREHRPIVVEVLAAMVAEQAALVVDDQQRKRR